jgi:hypothetical protein
MFEYCRPVLVGQLVERIINDPKFEGYNLVAEKLVRTSFMIVGQLW